MAAPLARSLLHAFVAEARRADPAPSVLAVHAAPRWSEDAELASEGGRVRVRACVSALDVRDALAGYDPTDGELLVLLTDLEEADLGDEVLARVWRRRLIRPSRWDALKQLFRAESLDPVLADARWLVDLLVEVAPVRGYPPPPSALLDVDTAWRTLLRHGLRIDVERPSLEDLLRWGGTEGARTAMNAAVAARREEIAERLRSDAGVAAGHVLRLVSEGSGAHVVPLGLVCDVLWAPEAANSAVAQAARIRLETPLGSKGLTAEAARAWAGAAVGVFRWSTGRGEMERAREWAEKAEALLKEVEATELAQLSPVLPLGFEQRVLAAADRIGATLDEATDTRLVALERAVEWVERHVLADSNAAKDRVERLRMAARLVRRLAKAPEELAPPDLAHAARAYVEDGAWMDRARESLSAGESLPALGAVIGRLLEAVDDVRSERDLRFARLLAGWSAVAPADSKAVLPIERVLSEVVGPLASQVPVLVVVLDGMAYADAIALTADLRGEGWRPLEPEERALAPVVAALPTVTVVSRASLLTGSLRQGGADVEAELFAAHPALKAAGGSAPRLFHKKDLKVEQGQLAPEVFSAVLDVRQRVLGVVVNALDDHLEKGTQLRLADGLRMIPPLRPLMSAAAESGRVVILVSDHGHVLETGSQVRPKGAVGERWRRPDPAPAADEVEIAGPRVLLNEGRIVAPGVERVRYFPKEKRGYHGGATPQEVLCPLFVLAHAKARLEGWSPVLTREPEWWRHSGAAPQVAPEEPPLEPEVQPDGQGLLPLDRAPAVAAHEAPWIERLLTSPMFASQRELAGRQALDDASVRAFLRVLGQRAGVAPPTVLVEALRLPPSRVRTKLEALRRMLNVDGYAVLGLDADGTARLNLELLKRQFGVEE